MVLISLDNINFVKKIKINSLTIIFSSINIPIKIINVSRNNFVDALISNLSSYKPNKKHPDIRNTNPTNSLLSFKAKFKFSK